MYIVEFDQFIFELVKLKIKLILSPIVGVKNE